MKITCTNFREFKNVKTDFLGFFDLIMADGGLELTIEGCSIFKVQNGYSFGTPREQQKDGSYKSRIKVSKVLKEEIDSKLEALVEGLSAEDESIKKWGW